MSEVENHRSSNPPGRQRNFATTHWSLVLEAGRQSPAGETALASLCETYWYPLYAYVRRRGYNVHDAQDLTQQFFARLLATESIAAADPERGRFRSFLLASLGNFLANEWRKDTAQKRGGGAVVWQLDFAAGEKRYGNEPAHEMTAESIFLRRWAMTLMERAVLRLHAEFEKKDKLALYNELLPYLGADSADRPPPHKEIAARLSLSESAVKVAIHRLRKRCRELLRDEIAQTVADPGEIDDELQSLFAAVAM